MLNKKYHREVLNMEYSVKVADFAHKLDKNLKNPFVINDLAQEVATFFAHLGVGEEEML